MTDLKSSGEVEPAANCTISAKLNRSASQFKTLLWQTKLYLWVRLSLIWPCELYLVGDRMTRKGLHDEEAGGPSARDCPLTVIILLSDSF